MNNIIYFFLLVFLFIKESFANDIIYNDKIIAVINNNLILSNDLESYCKIESLESLNNDNNLSFKNIILNKILINKIIKDIFKNNIIINNIDIKIDKYLNNISKNLCLNKKEFLHYINKNNLKIEEYKNFIKKKILINKIIKNKIYNINLINKNDILDFKKNRENNLIINDIFNTYNLDLIKIKNNNFDKNKFDIYKIIKNLEDNNNKKIKYNKKNNIIEVKNFNCYFNNLPYILKLNINKNYNNNKNIIGPIYISDFIYFIKINSIKKINNKNKIKLFTFDYFYNNEINDKVNSDNNLNYINGIKKKILNNYKNNNMYENYKNIICKKYFLYHFNKNKKFKIYLENIKKNKCTDFFEYKNKWGFIYLKEYEYYNYDEYLKDNFIKEYILKSKSMYLIKKMIDNYINNNYIKILDKCYKINI
ncbi:peptidylprolyl isomerase [endosymbiont of Euscepes postfasciatus]|uniref:hypothetical protein n=1 Tax=endosymbiont of Euscepes postfasciatus TaxID=650377 RepID=UPI000DC71AF3|nr:hypothetical protein [endosymbiont of Euscepes postfasciatus]BBA84621.1 peptidylprolyl isomerase [endosymbiont of Euscepes postfasciatus]